MLSILDIQKYLNRVIKKEQRGGIVDGNDYNIFFNVAQSEHFYSEISKAEATSDVIDGLRAFITELTNITSGGLVSIPTNPSYAKILASYRLYNASFVKCDHVTQLEREDRESNVLTQSTAKHPTVTVENGNFSFLPISSSNVKIIYYRKPLDLYLDWYWDANQEIQYLTQGQTYALKTGEVYSDGTIYPYTASSKTIDFEWTENKDRIAIAHRILTKLGVMIPNDLGMQLGMSETIKSETAV